MKMIHDLIPKKTAVVVVDMTKGFTEAEGCMYMPAVAKIKPKLAAFLDGCREAGASVVYANQMYRMDGMDIPKNIKNSVWGEKITALKAGTPEVEICRECAPKEGEVVIAKQHYNAFFNTNLDVVLQAMEVDTVVIVGAWSDVGCFFTARDAFYHNYKVVMLPELSGTIAWPECGYGKISLEDQHLAAINMLDATGAEVMTEDGFLEMLRGGAEHV